MKIRDILGVTLTTFSIVSCFKPIIGTPTDNQLISPLLAFSLIIFTFIFDRKLNINKSSAIVASIFVIASILCIVSIPFCVNDNLRIIRHSITYLLGSILIIASGNLLTDENIIKGCHLALIITYIGFVLQKFIPSLFNLFVFRGIYSLTNSRGLTSFFSEGGYTVTSMFAIILIYYVVQKKLYFINIFFPSIAILIPGAGQFLKTFGEFVFYSIISFLIIKLYQITESKKLEIIRFINFYKLFIINISIITIFIIILFSSNILEIIDSELPSQILGFGTRYIKLFFSAIVAGSDLKLLMIITDDNLLFKIAGYIISPIIISITPFNLCPMKLWSMSYYEQFKNISETYINNQVSIFGVYQFPDMPFFSVASLIIDFGLIGLISILVIIILGFKKVKDLDNFNNNFYKNSMVLGALITLIFDNHGIGMWVIWFSLGIMFSRNGIFSSPKHKVILD